MTPAHVRHYAGAVILTILAVLAAVGPGAFGLSDGIVSPPYSKPAWLDSSIASKTILDVASDISSGNVGGTSGITWAYDAPSRVSIIGTITDGYLEWITPNGRYRLAEGAGELDLDARDIPFKKSLGIGPFENMARVLFPARGSYVLSLSGGGNVVMTIEGGRWGLLGTDHRGRDAAALFIRGIRISLIVGITATLIAALLGVSLGILSGYAGGFTDTVIMRSVDVLLSIPTLPILMVLSGIWGKGLWNLVVILSIFSWMGTARTVRAMTLTLRDAPWVEGLRALGAKRGYIIFRHLAPEAMPLLLANIALGVPGAILAEAGLSFLGLSDPRLPSWGRMLHEAHAYGAFTSGAWWTVLPAGIGISMICLIFMDIGRKLEERADPRLAGGAPGGIHLAFAPEPDTETSMERE
ncbi:MAG: ABC transporter permease [Synergistaceae bacterium]|jgi:peptide/nickel transport system permease protein|nr:ABC transporter permease [Synergistaceae bacterium]